MPGTRRDLVQSKRNRRRRWLATVGFATLQLAASSFRAATAERLPCKPCAGVYLDDPGQILEQLTRPPGLAEDSVLFVAWPVPLDPASDASIAQRLAAVGATPWLRLTFTTPAPLAENLDALEAELEQASRLALSAGESAWFQIAWRPPEPPTGPSFALDYAFLIKRAAVAVTGAQVAAQVVSQPLAPDVEILQELYAQDVAAYLEGIALVPGTDDETRRAIDLLLEIDPGTPIVADGLDYPEQPWRTVPIAARHAVEGFSLSLFDASSLQRLDLEPF